MRHNCGWVLVCDRALFPRDQGPAAYAHKRTHTTHAPTHSSIHSVWNSECLYSQRNKAVSCVCDCLCFSWPEIAGLTVSHSAMTRGVDWTPTSSSSVGALVCLSLFAFVCAHDDSAMWLHSSGRDRWFNGCIGHQDGEEEQRYNYLLEVKTVSVLVDSPVLASVGFMHTASFVFLVDAY